MAARTAHHHSGGTGENADRTQWLRSRRIMDTYETVELVARVSSACAVERQPPQARRVLPTTSRAVESRAVESRTRGRFIPRGDIVVGRDSVRSSRVEGDVPVDVEIGGQALLTLGR